MNWSHSDRVLVRICATRETAGGRENDTGMNEHSSATVW